MSEVTMPRLSDTMQEGTIAHWLKKPGDEVKKGDTLAEIETDKATMELEAYDAGILEQILVQEGETVPIGQAVALIGDGTGAQKQEQPVAVANTHQSTQKQEQPATNQAHVGEVRPTPTPLENPQQERADTQRRSSNGALIKASPVARHMAAEHNIDLQQLAGTGPGGRIVRDDVEDFLEQQRTTPSSTAPSAATSKPTATTQEVPTSTEQANVPAAADAEVSPLSRIQTIIARRLTESKQTIPHFYVSSEVDMTDALAMRQVLNANVGEGGVKVSVNDLIVKACALALEKFPEVNSSFNNGQFVRYKHIHVGIAVDVPAGLVVPVIHDANIKGVRAIARESKALIEKARTNKLAPADLEGGTFSVSNLGMMDATDFIAVINPPQSAILAVASTRKHFVPIDDKPAIRDLMSLTLSADHRILYGATVARFLQEIKHLLQHPYDVLG